MSELTDNLATLGSEEKSFFELLKENKVSIPKIQRKHPTIPYCGGFQT